MTRKKEIFWGIYAAIVPCVVLYGINHVIWLLDKYRARTYDVMPAFMGALMLNFCIGMILAVLAIYFLSRPKETSKMPMIGLSIGLLHCAVIALYWPLGMVGVNMDVMWKILPKYGGETKSYLLLGYYIVLLTVYKKTKRLIPPENASNIGE